ncbi:MAG: SAM-dependent methyltransferase [Streptosporangiaceae bacterium]|jgi:S-adenosyl methyltransferase
MSADEDPLLGFDTSKPNIARVYNAGLGGKDNFPADRELLAMTMRIIPEVPQVARANRDFLDRAVRFMVAEAGLTQLLDIGSGLPTEGNVSEVAHDIDPSVHVVYVDNDPVVRTHAKALLADAITTDVITADAREPEKILADPTVRRLIDFGRPVGLLLIALLHHLADDEDPAGIMTTLRDAMPSGSYLAISSFRKPGPDLPEAREKAIVSEQIFAEHLGTGRWREDPDILAWFGDWELLDPGLVPLILWRNELPAADLGSAPLDPLHYTFVGGVARKP